LFGIGGLELTIIVIFGFLIFGPDKLPQIARLIGRTLRQFQDAQKQVTEVIKTEVVDPIKDSTGASDITAIKDDLQSLINDPLGNKKAETEAAAETKAEADTASTATEAKPVELPKSTKSSPRDGTAVGESSGSRNAGDPSSEPKKPAKGSFAERRAALEAKQPKKADQPTKAGDE
jgi:TatA/E family protein of Tat protein translocase